MRTLPERPCFYAFDVYGSMAIGFLAGLVVGVASMAFWIVNNSPGR